MQMLTSAYGVSASILSSSDGVAAANCAAAESLPFFPQAYELTPHCSRNRGTCMFAMVVWMCYWECDPEAVAVAVASKVIVSDNGIVGLYGSETLG